MLISIEKVPNFLTAMRLVFVPIICGLMYVDTHLTRILAIVFSAVACITDFFDGKIARKYNVVSAFGRCMDPIADKVLVMTLIVMLVYLEKAMVFPCIAILFREFVIAGIREFVAKENSVSIPVSKLAKMKTATQMVSLMFLMIFGTNAILYVIGNIFLTIAAVLSIITSIQYIASIKKYIAM